jgi:phage anti-repressor protein
MGSQPVFEDIRLFRIFYLRSVSCVTNVASVSGLTILDYPLKLEDTKEVIRSRKSKKGRQIQWSRENGQTVMYITLHEKLQIEHHQPH